MSELIPSNEHEPQPIIRREVEVAPFVDEYQETWLGIYKVNRLFDLINRTTRVEGVELIPIYRTKGFETKEIHDLLNDAGLVRNPTRNGLLIEVAIQSARSADSHISDEAARVIAFHLYQKSYVHLYNLATTGEIDIAGLSAEIRDMRGNSPDWNRRWSDWLESYALHRDAEGEVGPIDGWDKLWLEGMW